MIDSARATGWLQSARGFISNWSPALGLGLSPVNKALAVLILAATVLAIGETEPLLERQFGAADMAAELMFAAVFGAEYALPIWTAPLASPLKPRDTP